MDGFLTRMLHKGTVRRWRSAARMAPEVDLPALAGLRRRARDLRALLNQVIHVAEGRLARPRAGTSFIPTHPGTDWAWRPGLWCGALPVPGYAPADSGQALDDEVSVFHDCPLAEIALRQTRNAHSDDLAPYGLRAEVFGFDGSFLSISVDLPGEAAAGLQASHVLRLDALIDTDRATGVLAQLNIRHGPNTEQILRDMPGGSRQRSAEFDLAYAKLDERRIEKMWLDLLFDAPRMSRFDIRDITFGRRHRAEL